MEGVVRNAGTHAAGVIITDKPIIEYIPLHRPTGSSAEDTPVKTVTQFEMSVLEFAGLAEGGLPGAGNPDHHGASLRPDFPAPRRRSKPDNIPTDDPATYELMGRGETAGVFQVEGSACGAG